MSYVLFSTRNSSIFQIDTTDMGFTREEVKSVEHACQLLIDYLKEYLDPSTWDTSELADCVTAEEKKQRIWEYLTIIDLLEKKEDLIISSLDDDEYEVYIPLIERLAEQQ